MNNALQLLENILFVDIETVSTSKSFNALTPQFQELWKSKANLILKGQEVSDETVALSYIQRAGIYAEFAKVVCVSTGYFDIKGSKIKSFRVKSFYGHDEFEILNAFCKMIKKHFNQPKSQFLCGHNIKEFDVPFLCRRLLINSIKLPKIFDVQNKKPWEVKHFIDTLQMWKFGDYKNFISMDLLASVLGVKSPKQEMDGSKVHDAYWLDNDLKSIYKYCEEDVYAVAKVFLRLKTINIPSKLEFISKTKEY